MKKERERGLRCKDHQGAVCERCLNCEKAVRPCPSLLLDIERLELIRVLCRRGVQVHMLETLRRMHKDPFVPAGAWEDLRRAYDMMFPFPEARK